MKTLDFVLPAHFASALINCDYSGLEDEDIKLLDNLESENIKKYGRFYCVNADVDNTYFSPFNDMPGMRNIGSDVCTFTFDITPLSWAGLYCPKKNIESLINGMDQIKKNWENDRKKVDQIKLIFVGVDSWNRPVWKAPDIRAYYGSVNELFDYNDTEETVLKKVDTFDLCYFGDSFGCEPMGTSIPDKYYI